MSLGCFVCSEPASINEHHVVPQAKGGTDGPTVDLCANCHTRVHSIAKSMVAGKKAASYLQHLEGLDEAESDRVMGLAQIVALAADKTTTRPVLMVALEDLRYLDALKMFQRDHGFTSQVAAVNGILHSLSVKYGLLEPQTKNEPKVVKLSKLRRRE
jgi:hypothetical protein